MTTFVQIHSLMFLPPSNVNRDDTGRPKTAMVGGTPRVRVSSQALKRAWRTSPVFRDRIGDALASRTRRYGEGVRDHLLRVGADRTRATQIAEAVVDALGTVDEKAKAKGVVYAKELSMLSAADLAAADRVAEDILSGRMAFTQPTASEGKEKGAKKDEGEARQKADIRRAILRHGGREGDLGAAAGAADIGMFGRMFASRPEYNCEAAVQVAHAFTTSSVSLEDDYYVAVDDLNKGEEDAGAGFIGETAFASGVFYGYVCVDRDLLARNLKGDVEVARRAIHALTESVATIVPSGKTNAFASRSRASFMLVERGDGQPRTLSCAFAQAVVGADLMGASIAALREHRSNLTRCYPDDAPEGMAMDATGKGRAEDSATISDLCSFASA